MKHVVDELAGQLTGARIAKIYQPSPEILLFKLWNGKETLRLLISAGGQNGRIHLTGETWPNPHIPPRFCQLLRARISRIEALSIANEDRIVQFDCQGKQGPCRLLAELTGKHSNLILVDDQGIIIDVLKRVNDDWSKRSLLAGIEYSFPEKRVLEKKSDQPQTGKDSGISWNQYVEKLYSDTLHTESKDDFQKQLQQAVTRQIKKLHKRAVRIEQDIEKQKRADSYRQIGELLLANLNSIVPGQNRIDLLNYYLQPPETVCINLDPLLKPQQNAEKYFKLYKKSRRGQEHSQRRLLETQNELEWLEQIDYQLKDTVTSSDIEEIAQELRQGGLLKEKNNLHSKRTLQSSKPHETISPSGLRILWGRNNRQNDEISTKNSKKGDLWFHACNVPGAHVIMHVGSNIAAVTDEDIRFAAAIAAGYSKARHDHNVEVMQAEARFVHKPKGSRAGLVNVLQYKTLLVEPVRLN